MADFEELLRSEVARRRDDFTPAGDLTDRIHARVTKRRRQRQAVLGAAGAGLAAVVVAGVLLASPSSHQTVETADDHDASTTTAVTAPTTGGDETASTTEPTSAPTTTASPDAPGDDGAGSGSAGGDEGPGSTTAGSSEGPSPTTTARAGTTTTETGDMLLAPDGDTPAAGTCGSFTGTVVEVVLNPDIPSPRCVEVTADQRLQVRNAAGESVTVTFAGSTVALGDGDTHVFDQPFGDYLAPGVHRVTASIYGDSGAEIWLKPCADVRPARPRRQRPGDHRAPDRLSQPSVGGGGVRRSR